MSAEEKLIERLNDVLAWELAGVIQYLQHSVMVTGAERETFREFFHEGSEEARGHAEMVANRIAALGGVPTVEPQKIRQAGDLDGMLEAVLGLEVDALAAWERAHEAAGDVSKGYLFWIEEMVAEEQEHVDEMRKLTKKVSFGSEALSGSSSKAS